MHHCPFCKGEVSEDTIRFGGHCPSCLIEIPGEEAATDPGEQARVRQEFEARIAEKKRKARSRIFGGVAAVLLVAAVGGAVAFWPAQEDPELSEVEFYITPVSAHQDQLANLGTEDPAVNAKSRKVSTGRSSKSGARSGASGGSAPAPGAEGPSVSASAGSGSGSGEGVTQTGSSLNSPFAFSGSSPTARGPKGIVLSDPEAIDNMVRTVVTRGVKQLEQCYQTRLKEVESLKGKWAFSLVVATSGVPEGVRVQARSTSDAELESCIKRNVEAWRFQSINEAVTVGPVPLNFGT